MALSKAQKVAHTLNELTACNVHSAAGAHDWNELVEAYFCDDDEGSSDSDGEGGSDEEFVGLDDESLPPDHANVNNNVLDLDENEVTDSLLKNPAIQPPNDRPVPQKPPGLDEKHTSYLHRSIREFCTPDIMDITCPMPETLVESDNNETEEAPRKRKHTDKK
jgi:hypothetical protein